jgi:hypothetical protein
LNKKSGFCPKNTRQAIGVGAFCESGGRCTPLSILPFLTDKTLDYLIDNQAFVIKKRVKY